MFSAASPTQYPCGCGVVEGGGGGGGGAPGLGLQQTRFDVRGERLLEFRIATLILSEIQ